MENKRLIDANALDALENLDYDYAPVRDGCAWYRAADVWACIESQPAVDAVEVIRCKDCKHYVQFLQDNKGCRCTIFSGCYDRPYPTEPNDFCSYGERRTDNG